MLQHENSKKWTRGRDSVQQCFPTFRDWEFETDAYHTDYFRERGKVAMAWMGKGNMKKLGKINTPNTVSDVDQALTLFADKTALAMQTLSEENSDNHTITVPYLRSDILMHSYMYIDKYYDDLREYMQFDYDNCCKLKPDPDESVFVSFVVCKSCCRFRSSGEISTSSVASKLCLYSPMALVMFCLLESQKTALS